MGGDIGFGGLRCSGVFMLLIRERLGRGPGVLRLELMRCSEGVGSSDDLASWETGGMSET